MLEEFLNATVNLIKNNPRQNAEMMPTRIGKAAVGRIYNNLIRLVLINMLTIEEMNSTLTAVYGYMQNPNYTPDGYVKREIFDMLKEEIDKSAERSFKARQRAALRKAARESAAPQPVATPAAEKNCAETPHAEEAKSETVETTETAETVETVPTTTTTPTPTPQPRHNDDPDTIVCNYRPKKKPLPRYHVMTDEEMNAEPYDPFGARRAYEIQCGRRRW